MSPLDTISTRRTCIPDLCRDVMWVRAAWGVGNASIDGSTSFERGQCIVNLKIIVGCAFTYCPIGM